MNKEKTLEAIRNARDTHISQIEKIKALLNGEEVLNPTEIIHTKCAFGLWLYDENNHIEDILGQLFYQNLEQLHTRWHNEYSRIFNIFFTDRKKGFFSKILGLSNVDERELDKAKLYYSELKKTTEELLAVIASCERRTQALNESKFF